MGFINWLEKQSQPFVYLISFTMLVLIEYIDYVTPLGLHIAFLHLFPLFLILWRSGMTASLIYALTASIMGLLVELYTPNSLPIIFKWLHALSGLVYFVIFILLVGKIKNYLEKITQITQELYRSNRTLSNSPPSRRTISTRH